MDEQTTIVNLLIQAHASVNIQDNIGRTALIWGILIIVSINLKNSIKIY
jgi:hypothetical protein